MSEIQLGHDLCDATSVTTGGDGTTNKNLNYEVLNVNLDTEDTYFQSSGTRDPMGIMPKTRRQNTRATYFESKTDEEKRTLLQGAQDAMVWELGGKSVWEALHGEERQEKEEEILTRVCESLGPEAFERLPESEQRRLKIWVWVGCGMHKDLNAVKGGDSAMRQKWKELGVSPIPLPNKDNAAVLEALDDGRSDSEDYEEFKQEEEPVSEALSAAMLHRQCIAHDSTHFGESGASDLNRLRGCIDASGSNGPITWSCTDESDASGSNGPVTRGCTDKSGASDLDQLQDCVDASGSNGPVTWSCTDKFGASGSNGPVAQSCADESGASDLDRLRGCVDASGSNGPVTWSCTDESGASGSSGPVARSCADESGASDLNQRVNEVVKHAKNVTKGGGIRTGDLMGNYFRNKDKKKDTSNTRYSSYLEAAAVTIARPQFYIGYLEDVRDRKTNRKFNHLESNIYKALYNKSTLTELAVLALYQEAISHSYILAVRAFVKKEARLLQASGKERKWVREIFEEDRAELAEKRRRIMVRDERKKVKANRLKSVVLKTNEERIGKMNVPQLKEQLNKLRDMKYTLPKSTKLTRKDQMKEELLKALRLRKPKDAKETDDEI
ncbi:hypothetical protein ACEPAF_2144 [Sanghuangporus sanghuang]